jgi:hypothetical protein
MHPFMAEIWLYFHLKKLLEILQKFGWNLAYFISERCVVLIFPKSLKFEKYEPHLAGDFDSFSILLGR